MSVRAIWIISLSKNEFGSILFYRRFPTVERKCQVTYKENYIGLPPVTLFASNLLIKLQLTDSKQFVDWRDKANGVMQRPVTELDINNETIWPIVAVIQGSYLACCLPFVEDFQDVEKDNLLKIPSISIGFSVLLGILNMFDKPSVESRQNKLIDLDNFLSVTMPFGTTSDVDLFNASSLIKNPPQKFSKKQPAWKPVDSKGKQLLHVKITEFVRCVQSNQTEYICHFETFGQVSVKADLEGGVRDVSLSVYSVDPAQPLSFDSLVIHPCVTIPGGPFLLGAGLPKRLRFSPPNHEFVLFHYRSLIPEDPPIQGVFKMLGENNNAELSIHLRLNQKVKNSFEFCDLILVFFNRGPVKNSEFNVNHGNPRLTEDKYTLKWSLGTKFPKDLEVILTAKLEFQDGPLLPNSDPFCVDKNCYVQLNFQQNNATLSGCNIDPKSITFSEGSKPKIMIDRSVQSTEYRIWNKFGDVPFAINLHNKFDKVFL